VFDKLRPISVCIYLMIVPILSQAAQVKLV
jgi:hypothetical protein